MLKNFAVNQLIICINDYRCWNGIKKLRIGNIYTVREIQDCVDRKTDKKNPGLCVYGIVNKIEKYSRHEWMYKSSCFIPFEPNQAIDKTNNKIKIKDKVRG